MSGLTRRRLDGGGDACGGARGIGRGAASTRASASSTGASGDESACNVPPAATAAPVGGHELACTGGEAVRRGSAPRAVGESTAGEDAVLKAGRAVCMTDGAVVWGGACVVGIGVLSSSGEDGEWTSGLLPNDGADDLGVTTASVAERAVTAADVDAVGGREGGEGRGALDGDTRAEAVDGCCSAARRRDDGRRRRWLLRTDGEGEDAGELERSVTGLECGDCKMGNGGGTDVG